MVDKKSHGGATPILGLQAPPALDVANFVGLTCKTERPIAFKRDQPGIAIGVMEAPEGPVLLVSVKLADDAITATIGPNELAGFLDLLGKQATRVRDKLIPSEEDTRQ